MIGPENSHPSSQPVRRKIKKKMATWSPEFSAASNGLLVFTLSSHWLIILLTFVLISSRGGFGFGF